MEAAANRCHHGANVRRWREWRGYNQGAFAGKLGIEPARLSVYERRPELDKEFLEKVAKELNIPLEALTEMEEGATVNIFSGTFSGNALAGGGGQLHQPIFNPLEKLVELYDRMLAEKDDKIAALQKIIDAKK